MGFTASAMDALGKNSGKLLIVGGALLAAGSAAQGLQLNPLSGTVPSGAGFVLGIGTMVLGGALDAVGGL